MINQSEYQALQGSSALQLRPDAGVLILTDTDRSDFLQRMTTNNISALKLGQSCVTVLTSPTARNQFVFSVLCRAEELWLLPGRSETTALEKHLRGNIFFMDKVRVRNASADWLRMRVMGPQATDVLSDLGIERSLTDDGWQQTGELVAVRQEKFDVPGYELLVAAAAGDEVQAKLSAAGCILLADDAAYTARRVEMVRPLAGRELTGDYSPLESGLAWTCVENKGCYTGQEIIARQITYDKVTKTLVGLSAASTMAVGESVVVEGKEVGTITSSAFSPTANSHLAIAILKRPHNAAGAAVSVAGVSANVQDPFR